MNIAALKNQLLHDLKASWQKTAVLGVLFAVGCVFWLPPIVRAFTGGSATPSTTAAAIPSTAAATASSTPSPETTAKETPFSWEQAEKVRGSSPLMQSANVAAIHGDPFRLDRDQFSPPIAFADEPVREVSLSSETDMDTTVTDKLILKSTIVGVKRRAALINDKLYLEGRTITVEGQTYVLTSVQPRRVVLTQGETVFELTIPLRYEGNAGDER